jgi:predicted RNA-binding Zn ribbon-like protein
MALIEIPNVYDSDMAVSTARRGRFAVIGEPVVAVDLINTVAPPGTPAADDLLSSDPQAAVAELNFFMQSAPASTRLQLTGTGLRAETHWHCEYGGNPKLAFIATQAAASLSDPSQVSRLRRCANPACSMIFMAVNPRRSWCAPGVCGNRVRVARHHRRAGGS